MTPRSGPLPEGREGEGAEGAGAAFFRHIPAARRLVDCAPGSSQHHHHSWLFYLLSGIVDTIDGQVARNGAMATRFGAFYDSTLDRIGDGAIFAGVGTYLMFAPDVAYRELSVIVCMVGIIASLVVSYARARAEGLGLECKVGIAQRAERILLLGIPPLLFGAGPGGIYLQVIVVLLTALGLITVVQRIVHVHGAANAADLAGLQDRE
jgi:CDP-diacylglycerol--glycerol-3-phosphate 3-phosphatidyltransferase